MDSLKDFHFDQNVFSKQFEKDLNELGIHLEEKQFYQFKLYYEILMEWNSFMNLTTITDFEEVVLKHFIDSISLVKAIPDLSPEMWLICEGLRLDVLYFYPIYNCPGWTEIFCKAVLDHGGSVFPVW